MSTIVERRIFTNRVKNLDNIVCANCGSINIQMENVVVYPNKNGNENKSTVEINITSGKVTTGKQVGHQKMSNNVLSFICSCSHCHKFSRFDVVQHKDEGYIKTYPVEDTTFDDVKS